MSASQQSLVPLFDLPRSRHADPASSRYAEEKLRHSGAMGGQRKLALDLVNAYPGRTVKQLVDLGTLSQIVLCKRLPEVGLWQIQCGTFDSIWLPYCDCGPWCEHIRAEELVRQYKRIRITDPGRRKAEYRLENGSIELKVTDRIWQRAVIREAA